MDRVSFIRVQERKYHEALYDTHVLFQEGTWLHKPVKTVMDYLGRLELREQGVTVLDLGCGVGRNSIPIARAIANQRNSKVVCVDILDSAIERLNAYSEQYHVRSIIEPYVLDIADYRISPDTFDYIVAISSLEHVHSEAGLNQVLRDMVQGTKKRGINCIIINANVQEFDVDTGQRLEPMIEVNLSTERVMQMLNGVYQGWNLLAEVIRPLAFQINRDGRAVTLKTNAVTFVTQKIN